MLQPYMLLRMGPSASVQSEATGRTELRPEGCALHEFRRDEALRCLARPNGQAAILFLGAR